MAKQISIESMTRFVVGIFTIRCWREEAPGFDLQKTKHEIQNLLIQMRASNEFDLTDEDIARKLLFLPRMNAVEVLHEGDGVVLYADWP